MFPVAQAVVDDQGDDHISWRRFSVGNIFAPERAPGPMAIHAVARLAVIGPTVPAGAGGLIGHVFSRGQGDAARKNQRRSWADASQKSDRFVDRGDALAGAKHCPAGQDKKVAAKTSTQLLEITGIDVRMLPRQVHFAHDRSPVLGRAGRLIRDPLRDGPRGQAGPQAAQGGHPGRRAASGWPASAPTRTAPHDPSPRSRSLGPLHCLRSRPRRGTPE